MTTYQVQKQSHVHMDCCCCLVAKSCLTVTFVIPWTLACQAPLPMGVSRQENWIGLTFLFPGDLSDPGIKFTSPGWQPNSLPLSHLGKCRHVQSLWKANWIQSHSMTQFHSYAYTQQKCKCMLYKSYATMFTALLFNLT